MCGSPTERNSVRMASGLRENRGERNGAVGWFRRPSRRIDAGVGRRKRVEGGWSLRDVLAIVLAGGQGTRLEPLTRDRAKPAVPFGGLYRIIDFTLSNCINSGLRRILVLTQYKAVSLDRHIDQGWRFLSRELDEYIEVLPPAAADRRALVQGDRRRHLPEHLHDREGGPARHADPGRRPHLQDGLRAT